MIEKNALLLREINRRVDDLNREREAVIVASEQAEECIECEDFIALISNLPNLLKRINRRFAEVALTNGYSAKKAADIRELTARVHDLFAFACDWAALHTARGYAVEGYEPASAELRNLTAMLSAIEHQEAIDAGFYIADQQLLTQLIAMPPIAHP